MITKNIFNEDWGISNEITLSLIKDLIKKRDNQIKAKLSELGIPTDIEYIVSNCKIEVDPDIRRYTLFHKGQRIIIWHESVNITQEGGKIIATMNGRFE